MNMDRVSEMSDRALGHELDKSYEGRNNFTASLALASTKPKGLSQKQRFWAEKLVSDARTNPNTNDVRKVAENADAVFKMFETAGKKLKYPKITFVLKNFGEIRMWVAGDHAHYPGTITIRARGDYVRNIGRIDRDGTIHINKSKVDDTYLDFLFNALSKFIYDPVKVAAEYGMKTGNCCFCSRPLKDERSTEMGYGPICAKNFDLPWGK